MHNLPSSGMRLVADVGGTNTRMALSCDGAIVPGTVRSYANDEWDDFYLILASFLAARNTELDEMVIAVAGPVDNGQAQLTNRSWVIEASHIGVRFDCGKIHLLNDLNALAYATQSLNDGQLRQVRVGVLLETSPAQSLVVGVGTGFNVGPVLEQSGVMFCPAVEAGHATLPFSVSRELIRAGIDVDLFETVEALFSGRGFTRFCQQMTGEPDLDGRAVISAYKQGGPQSISAAVELYAKLFGRLLGDLSMAYMPTSGMYLAGSVARAIMQVAQKACLEGISRHSQISASFNAPVWVIEDDAAALIGCMGYAFD
ncbi:ROK family protein [uncultured Sulfitobacter sp.]|uniref:glucokinase n=1 Tax=uncultured Sulfitobacter sp. TaxID=191468 RepID=UPI00261F8EBC|nr:ROK family protein [uncultured Sulfitobacter sp.]